MKNEKSCDNPPDRRALQRARSSDRGPVCGVNRRARVTTPVLYAIGAVALLSVVVTVVVRFSPDADVSRPPASDTINAGPSIKRAIAPDSSYIGSQECADCHAEIYTRYMASPMARTLRAITDSESTEDDSEQPSFKSSGRREYAVEKRDDRVVHREVRRDDEGQVIYDRAVPVDYVIGSGVRGHSYLTNREGLLFQSPITWYSERKTWGLSPGYETSSRPRFERRVVDACISCHSGRVANKRGIIDRFDNPPFLEESISCERCHGPGERHAAFHGSGSPDSESDSIINPAKLAPRLRESVCNQCHLSGVARFPRYGATDFDFRPGDDLSDIWTTFISGTRIADGQGTQAVSQVEQMHSSECFRQSDGRLGCISCHDAHGPPSPADRISFYVGRCMNCHGTGETGCSRPETEGDDHLEEHSCMECHMPSLQTSDIPHTSQTDHRIIRSAASSATPAPHDVGQIEFFDHADDRLTPLESQRARGLLYASLAEQKKSAVLAYKCIEALADVVEAAPDDVPSLLALGTAYRMSGQLIEALELWESILKVDPKNEAALRELAILSHDTKRYEQGIEYLQQLFELNSWQSRLHGRMAHMQGHVSRFQEGIKSAKRSLELDPAQPLIHSWLADVYDLTGESEPSTYHRGMAERLSSP